MPGSPNTLTLPKLVGAPLARDHLNRSGSSRFSPDSRLACFVVSSDGEIRQANESAMQMHGIEDGDELDNLAFCPASIKLLKNTISSAFTTSHASYHQFFHHSTQTPVLARISTMGASLQIETTDICWPISLSSHIQSKYGLSLAELAVFESFIEGLTPQEIARAKNCSLATVRSQQRALFDKFDVNSMCGLFGFSFDQLMKFQQSIEAGSTLDRETQKLGLIDAQMVLCENFLLSRTETAIANDLMKGATPSHVAQTRQASVRTVRTQISNMLMKIGARNTPELVRLIQAFRLMHMQPQQTPYRACV